MQANPQKFTGQAEILARHLPLQNARVLDIGCGGGLFLSLIKQAGADVRGWDVIEHVNYPQQTFQSAANVLKPGGLLLVDTPCRDSFYHRFGELTYKLTGDKYPTFLNVMYSSQLFEHKQIFSTTEMKKLFEAVGLQVIDLHKFHELSFPYEFYLKKLFKLQALVHLLLPVVQIFFRIFKIQNKMLVAGKANSLLKVGQLRSNPTIEENQNDGYNRANHRFTRTGRCWSVGSLPLVPNRSFNSFGTGGIF